MKDKRARAEAHGLRKLDFPLRDTMTQSGLRGTRSSAGLSKTAIALKDIYDGMTSMQIWSMLAWQEIRNRYKRSVLGPFWLTISTGILIGAMGPLYSKLFGQPLSAYFSHLAISLVLWVFIAGMITDACLSFISAEGYITQIKLPLTVHVMRVVYKNLLILAHNFVIVFVVLLFYPPAFSWHLLLALLGVILITINGIWMGILLGLICARFRDIPPIVTSLVQVAMFLTPVFWTADMLGRNRWVADVNPVFHFLEIVRRPLMGQSFEPLSWVVVLLVTILGYPLMLAFFQRFRARIAYWV